MKQLGAAAYDEIRKWIYRNARPLDLALWQFEFEGGNRETVMEMVENNRKTLRYSGLRYFLEQAGEMEL